MGQRAAWLYAAICLGTAHFQLCLIGGAPWGRLIQGGTHGRALPIPARVFAGLSIVLLSAMALAILSAAGRWPGWPIWTGWAVLAVQGLSVMLNLITPSAAERRLWGPVTAAMLLLALIVMATR